MTSASWNLFWFLTEGPVFGIAVALSIVWQRKKKQWLGCPKIVHFDSDRAIAVYWRSIAKISAISLNKYLFVVHLPVWTLALVLDFPSDDAKRPDVRCLRIATLADRFGCAPLVEASANLLIKDG